MGGRLRASVVPGKSHLPSRHSSLGKPLHDAGALLQNLNMRLAALPPEHDIEGLQRLAAAVAAQLVPALVQSNLQGSYLSLRMLECPPDRLAKVRSGGRASGGCCSVQFASAAAVCRCIPCGPPRSLPS